MNKIIFKIVLILLSLVKKYPVGSYEYFGLHHTVVLIESLYGLEKRMNIQDMDNLLTATNTNWSVEKNFGDLLDNIIKDPNETIKGRYYSILKDMLLVYGRKRIKELEEDDN